ncbi:hypothetical protein D8674_008207 [Pyrus ussuriensis x Pyrus communis]|uniref:Secreted protein n=1 Tax=Pyrus ussuriensis x Pyrus communis TaxID=2448454 RepID=A0A5N5HT13_9ROSA|nr:hypothetical protein D8674_008207 [Pyrus ussuriensis x Pyrus communis]
MSLIQRFSPPFIALCYLLFLPSSPLVIPSPPDPTLGSATSNRNWTSDPFLFHTSSPNRHAGSSSRPKRFAASATVKVFYIALSFTF